MQFPNLKGRLCEARSGNTIWTVARAPVRSGAIASIFKLMLIEALTVRAAEMVPVNLFRDPLLNISTMYHTWKKHPTQRHMVT